MKDRKLNAIPPRQLENAEQRTARHVRMCVELADLAMQLARNAAARALADHAEPESPGTAASRSDKSAESSSEPVPASSAAPRRGSGTDLRAASCKAIDPALLFTRLAAVVRYCINLEIRLTVAGTAPPASAAATPSRTDPRRTPLRETFRYVTTSQPDQAGALREINARLDEHLAADPAQTLTLPEIFNTICEDLDFEPDFATLPDQYLDLITDEIPNPRATSPP